jgi:hypothetical protein
MVSSSLSDSCPDPHGHKLVFHAQNNLICGSAGYSLFLHKPGPRTLKNQGNKKNLPFCKQVFLIAPGRKSPITARDCGYALQTEGSS